VQHVLADRLRREVAEDRHGSQQSERAGILALLCGGCAAGHFDLVPRDPEAPWHAGPRQVRVESSNATIKASYDGIWLDNLAFMVEVVNQTDSVLVVDPQRFTLTLATTRSVIVDEIHALAPNKRGAHLALSLERLAALCGR